MELRVFLVEDLQNMRGLMQEVFASIRGVRLVGTAGTEAEANLWLDENGGGWDVAIVDLVLEQGSGLGVVRRAKLTRRHGRVAVFSSYATAGVRAHLLQLGADIVIDKNDTAAFIAWLAAEVRHANPGKEQ